MDRTALDASIAKGIHYLRVKGQNENGSYSDRGGPGYTALATMAVLSNGVGVDDPQVAKALKYLDGFVQKDGSITSPKPGVSNYETSLCIACFALANKDGRYRKAIGDAAKYLKNVQLDEGEKRTRDSVDYGGAGYNSKTPGGDLSNTATLVDALKASGAGPNDEAIQRALIFVSRCQNLETEHNLLPFAAKINDGGFFYSPNGPGYSPAGKETNGGLRSYGSMTYAGLKSMLVAGVKADDPRVKAALQWLRTHYSMEENPGLGQQGLYYYYHLMAKALDAVGAPEFEDAAGVKHNWRAELSATLIGKQGENGSWINPNHRWYESNPDLATSYALLALSHCREAK
ncbi:MAG: terpene cyclase/mutase family protein [Planctomycetia bacterium]|nr:terpene cyclase/mutase family protein [Planctomycetia bacterium]